MVSQARWLAGELDKPDDHWIDEQASTRSLVRSWTTYVGGGRLSLSAHIGHRMSKTPALSVMRSCGSCTPIRHRVCKCGLPRILASTASASPTSPRTSTRSRHARLILLTGSRAMSDALRALPRYVHPTGFHFNYRHAGHDCQVHEVWQAADHSAGLHVWCVAANRCQPARSAHRPVGWLARSSRMMIVSWLPRTAVQGRIC